MRAMSRSVPLFVRVAAIWFTALEAGFALGARELIALLWMPVSVALTLLWFYPPREPHYTQIEDFSTDDSDEDSDANP